MRKSSGEERRIVYLAIEGINSVRPYGYVGPVTKQEIREYTQLADPAIEASIKWLKGASLIVSEGRYGWRPLPISRRGLCWTHGFRINSLGECTKCKKERSHAKTDHVEEGTAGSSSSYRDGEPSVSSRSGVSVEARDL